MTLEALKHTLGGAIQPLMSNYRDPPVDAQFGSGHLWRRVERGGKTFEEHYTGLTFHPESPRSSLLKTAALVACGSNFFSVVTAYHFSRTLYELGLCGNDLYQRFKLVKSYAPNMSREEFVQSQEHKVHAEALEAACDGTKMGLKEFIQSQKPEVYAETLKAASKGLKSLACGIPFAMMPLPHALNLPAWLPLPTLFNPVHLLTDTDLGFYVGLSFIAYAAYDPRYPRVLLNQIEQWVVTPSDQDEVRSKNTGNKAVANLDKSAEIDDKTAAGNPTHKTLSDLTGVKEDDFFGIMRELFEFNVPFSFVLGWESVSLPKKKAE